jgi:hypothetical protein
MHRDNWLIPVICIVFLFGCASKQKPKTIKSLAETTLPKPAPGTPAAKKEVQEVMSADGSIKGEIVGTPAPDSKFTRLQIGMTLEQVEKLIGLPDDTDSRVTGKQYQPFHFGGDTQRTEAFYKGEGQLTFSNTQPDSAADRLIRIMVDPNATGSR